MTPILLLQRRDLAVEELEGTIDTLEDTKVERFVVHDLAKSAAAELAVPTTHMSKVSYRREQVGTYRFSNWR